MLRLALPLAIALFALNIPIAQAGATTTVHDTVRSKRTADWSPGEWKLSGALQCQTFSTGAITGGADPTELTDSVTCPVSPDEWAWSVAFSWFGLPSTINVQFRNMPEGATVWVDIYCSHDYADYTLDVDLAVDAYTLTDSIAGVFHSAAWSGYPNNLPLGFDATALNRCNTEPLPPVDRWVTWRRATLPAELSFHDFADDPIPANFFDPGSDPFDGRVELKGVPIDPDRFGNADTLVQRLGTPVLPSDIIGAGGMVELELVELRLRSIAPITVSVGDAKELWMVDVALSGLPVPRGQMTATKTHLNGGTFVSTWNVQLKYIFTRLIDGAERIFDCGVEGRPPISLSGTGEFVHTLNPQIDFVIDPSATFIPGISQPDPANLLSQQAFVSLESGTNHTHAVGPPSTAVPVWDFVWSNDPVCWSEGTWSRDALPLCTTFPGGVNTSVAPPMAAAGARSTSVAEAPPSDDDSQSNLTTAQQQTAMLPSSLVRADARTLRVRSAPQARAFHHGDLIVSSAGPSSESDFRLDDGSAENSVGVDDGFVGAPFGWANRFSNTLGRDIRLGSIDIAFGKPGGATGVQPGDAVDAVVWIDPTASGSMANAVKLLQWSLPGGVHANDGTFKTFEIPGGALIPDESEFYVGLGDIQTEIDSQIRFPASIDQTSSAGRSWVFFGVSVFDPDNLTSQTITLIEGFGFPGNWLVRADIVHGNGGGHAWDFVLCSEVPNEWQWKADFECFGLPATVSVRFVNFVPDDELTIEIYCGLDLLQYSVQVDIGNDIYDIEDALGLPIHSGSWSGYPGNLPVAFSATGFVRANRPVTPSIDRWTTWREDGGPELSKSDFNEEAIPSGFFATGSDAFTGVIEWKGEPIDPDQFGDADTLVSRSGDPVWLHDPVDVSGSVELKLVTLSLVSVAPVTITFNGGQMPETWDVRATLSSVSPPPGELAAIKTHRNGGTFESRLTVQPRLIFTRTSDGLEKIFDTGERGLPHDVLVGSGTFVHMVDPDLQGSGLVLDKRATFIPGIDQLVPGDTTSQVVTVITEEWPPHSGIKAASPPTRSHAVCLPRRSCMCDADVDGNGSVQSSDLAAVVDCSNGECAQCVKSCDVNCDGSVDDRDVNITKCRMVGGLGEVCCSACPSHPAPIPDLITVSEAGDLAVVIKNRYISFQTGPDAFDVGVRVTLLAIPQEHLFSNGGSVPDSYLQIVGTQLWVAGPMSLCSIPSVGFSGVCNAGVATLRVARLQCDPFFHDWASEGLVHAFGNVIIPGAVYAVEVVDSLCGPPETLDPTGFSPPLIVTHGAWADVTGPFLSSLMIWGPPEGTVDIATDAVALLDAFKGKDGALNKARSDLEGTDPNDRAALDGVINIGEVIQGINGFKGLPYPFGPGRCTGGMRDGATCDPAAAMENPIQGCFSGICEVRCPCGECPP